MLCRDIMKVDAECLSPDATIQEAANLMREANVGFLPVCDENKQVLGTLTDRDIVIRAVAEGAAPSETRVQDCMSRDIVACRPDDDLREAETLMAQRQKSRILCLDENGRLQGVISLSGIVQKEEDSRAAWTMRKISSREAHLH